MAACALPAEYLPTSEPVVDDELGAGAEAPLTPTPRDEIAEPPKGSYAEKPPPRIALSSRLCTLVGAAFLMRGGWWPAVFVRHFVDELDQDDALLDWARVASASHGATSVPAPVDPLSASQTQAVDVA